MHRIGWFNHDDDELVLARYRDFNGQYIAQNSLSASSSYYLHGYSPKDEDMSDPRKTERFEPFAIAPTIAAAMDPPEATYHQVPSGSTNANGLSPRANQYNNAVINHIAQIAYRQAQCDEVRLQFASV